MPLNHSAKLALLIKPPGGDALTNDTGPWLLPWFRDTAPALDDKGSVRHPQTNVQLLDCKMTVMRQL